MLGVLFVSISVLRVEDDASLRLLRPTFTVFQSPSSVWRTTGVAALQDVQLIISIHVLRVEDDLFHVEYCEVIAYFNPRPPCGGRRHCFPSGHEAQYFNPRPPCGGRPIKATFSVDKYLFQSPSSVWRTTPLCALIVLNWSISIPVLRVEDDGIYHNTALFVLSISIPVLRVEDDRHWMYWWGITQKFQSPSSVWRTTGPVNVKALLIPYFNPRPPCGGRPAAASLPG